MNNKLVLPSNKKFGYFFSIIFFSLYLYLLLLNNHNSYLTLIISLVLLLVSFFRPKFLEKPNYMWFKFGIILGKIFSPLILGFIFFIIITPVAIFMKIIKRDALKLNKTKVVSYWENYEEKEINMKNQY